jgi:3-oxoacyl-[acyl-carrier protein] reductase
MLIIVGASGGLGNGLLTEAAESSTISRLFGRSRGTVRSELNLTDESSVASFASQISKELSPSEGLFIINASGVSINGMAPKQHLDDFKKTLDVNVTGNFLLIKHFQPTFKSHPGSAMVTLSSVVADLGVPGTISYSTSKSALRGFARTAARELARINARFNVLELGYFDRGMIKQVTEDYKKTLLSEIPLGRLGSIEALLEACTFCLKCDYLTGAVIKLNGGLT